MLILLGLVWTAAAAFVQGVAGFAFALLTVPVISLAIGPGPAAGLVAALGTMVMVSAVIVHHDDIEWKGISRLIAIALVSMPAGALFVTRAPESVVLTVLGLVTAAVGLLQLRRALAQKSGTHPDDKTTTAGRTQSENPGENPRSTSRRIAGVFAAMAAGVLGGAYATPGPPIVAYLYASTPDRRTAKANLQAFFLAIAALTVVTHIVAGNLTLAVLPFVAAALPGVIVATVLGAVLSKRMNVERLRLITDAALVLLGLALVIQAVAG